MISDEFFLFCKVFILSPFINESFSGCSILGRQCSGVLQQSRVIPRLGTVAVLYCQPVGGYDLIVGISLPDLLSAQVINAQGEPVLGTHLLMHSQGWQNRTISNGPPQAIREC